ncbi:MAG: hypothetical protein SGPRY_014090 [Prymnesium sp.]
MIKALMLLSLSTLLPLLPARAVRPAAWRAAQYQHVSSELLHPSRGPLTGAPPCLSSLTKSGRGHEASWSLGSYEAGGMCLQVSLALDRNPDEPCYKLLFNEAERGKMGHMLLAAGEQYSALRGMRIREDLRGCGYSKLLLSIWLEMCIRARLTPRTRVINKPLLSLSLSSFGFLPSNRRGRVVSITPAVRLRDCKRGDALQAGRSTYVRTDFEAPSEEDLKAAVQKILCVDQLETAAPDALRQALTLRVCS